MAKLQLEFDTQRHFLLGAPEALVTGTGQFKDTATDWRIMGTITAKGGTPLARSIEGAFNLNINIPDTLIVFVMPIGLVPFTELVNIVNADAGVAVRNYPLWVEVNDAILSNNAPSYFENHLDEGGNPRPLSDFVARKTIDGASSDKSILTVSNNPTEATVTSLDNDVTNTADVLQGLGYIETLDLLQTADYNSEEI